MATPPRPQDFKDRDQFFDGYSLYLAKVDTARDFMSQFDPANIEARIKDLNQQLARQGI